MVTDKKNQHYVPKFYLRNFSFQKNKKQIGIFNLSNQYFFSKAALKTQASKNFFYGRDGLIEDLLADIEGDLSSIIRNIIQERSIPKRNSPEHIELLYFIALTDLRSPVKVKQLEQLYLNMSQHFAIEDPNFDFEKFLPPQSSESLIKMNLNAVPRVTEYMKDLDYKLLVNRTSKPLITSDYPIVRYNQFLEEKKHPQSNTGYGSVGLQIFIPLNDELILVLYDIVSSQ